MEHPELCSKGNRATPVAKPHDPIKLAKAREYSKTGRGKLIREMAGLSMGELARWCASSQPTISGWERGLHDPTGDAAVKWAEVLAKLAVP